jgi:hypothetical protein
MAVFPKSSIEEMVKPEAATRHGHIVIGVDVARGGRDRTAITALGCTLNRADFLECKVLDTRDIMVVVGTTAQMAESYKAQRYKVQIAVDSVGMGTGVNDRLREIGYDVQEFVAGSHARDTSRFFNYKSEVAFRAAEAAKAGLIRNVPPASKFVLQLRSWTYEIRSDRSFRIIDPEDKSPDEADSLIIALSRFIYHEDAVASSQDIQDRPAWTLERPRDLLKYKR